MRPLSGAVTPSTDSAHPLRRMTYDSSPIHRDRVRRRTDSIKRAVFGRPGEISSQGRHELSACRDEDPVANEGVIEDGAVDALKDMSNYLMQAKTLGSSHRGQPGRRHRRRPAHPAGRNDHLQDPPAGLRHRLYQRHQEPSLHLRRQELHRLFAQARLLRQRPGPRHQPGSAGHHLQQIRHLTAAGRPVPLGRRDERRPHQGPEVGL